MRITAETRFAIIPEWVLFARISPAAVRLYGVLAREADKDEHFAIVGRAKLAKQMGCAVHTVDRAMTELLNLGAVSIERRSDPSNPLHLLPNRYHLAVAQPKLPAQGSPKYVPSPVKGSSPTSGDRPKLGIEEREGLGVKGISSSSRSSQPTKAPAPRARDPVFEALCQIQGHGWDDLNSTERGRLNKARRLAAESKASPEAIQEAANRWPDVMGDATMTAIGVMGNFHRLLAGPSRRRSGRASVAEEWLREQEALPDG